MVVLTNDYLSTKVSGVLAKKSTAQSNEDYLKKKTHLILHDQKISDIGDFSICKNLTVLYLHDNQLTEIKHLDHATNLTHLYLQNNKISKIENLQNLKYLCKLYLGCNEISVLEGLEAHEWLEELHLEKQRLADGEELHFDPRSVAALAGRLRLLDVSGAGLRSLQGAQGLRALQVLRAGGNPLERSAALAEALAAGAWPRLRELDVRGSPAARERRHRALLVAAAPASLGTLDGREVAECSRAFLRGMQACQPRAAAEQAGDAEPLLNALAPDIGVMALRLAPGVRRAVSRSLVREAACAVPAFACARALPLPLPPAPRRPPVPAAFPAWRRPTGKPSPLPAGAVDSGGGGEGAAADSRSRVAVPRPFWRQRAPARPARQSTSCPLRLPAV